MNNVLIVVPARGGSRGIPGKNLRAVGGISLVGRSVLIGRRFAALGLVPDIRVVVDSDDPTILLEGRRWGAETPYVRPASLAQDHTSSYESLSHLLRHLSRDGFEADTVLLLQPTSPLRSLEDVYHCWEHYVSSGVPSVISVSEAKKSPRLAMQRDDNGVLIWDGIPPPANVRRQELSPAYFPNGSVYIVGVRFLFENRAFVVAGRTQGVVTPFRTSIDVDDEVDLVIANALSNWRPNVTQVVVLDTNSVQNVAQSANGATWSGSDKDIGQWVSGGWPLSTDVMLYGTLAEDTDSHGSPLLGVWRSLGVRHLTLVIRDDRVLDRYRRQLALADRILIPIDLVEQVRAALVGYGLQTS